MDRRAVVSRMMQTALADPGPSAAPGASGAPSRYHACNLGHWSDAVSIPSVLRGPAGCCAGLADASGALQIAPLDLSSSAAPPGPVASSLDSEATGSEALLGSSAPSPSTVLPLHPSQVGPAP